jgi:hypothetical protein
VIPLTGAAIRPPTTVNPFHPLLAVCVQLIPERLVSLFTEAEVKGQMTTNEPQQLKKKKNPILSSNKRKLNIFTREIESRGFTVGSSQSKQIPSRPIMRRVEI